ncbi:acyltransferase [Echinimonas agarilytica]|uniref:Acyltransferase n=1 Tax=Echinimonas agarilytica TaxID=1215918 RepID=A0AA42B682_9GAMM|nr:acyltransferase [Echinimonas agarilytica]MCM2678191.1 acyltransferase [Echinimonas agarilytica]
MLSFLPGPFRGLLGMLLYIANTVFWVIPIFVFAVLKWIIPITFWRQWMSTAADVMASNWIMVNSWNQSLFLKIDLTFESEAEMNISRRYLVISNHQSWVDILLLQRVFHRKIPFLKFFLKKELIYVPILGLAWWALDFPFMQRYSKSFIKKNPHLAGKDIETTRAACQKFRTLPVSIMNFVEGTRITDEKHTRQKSPYANLLKPKAGGIGFVLSSMGDQLDAVLDVTIAYDGTAPTFWEFICGKLRRVTIHVRTIPLDQSMLGNYTENKEFRVTFQRKINSIWAEKDQRLSDLKNKS